MKPGVIGAALASLLLLGACSEAGQSGAELAVSTAPVFHADGFPERLSDWNLMRIQQGELALNDRVIPYDLNTPLFSDYALKLRTVWLPEGEAAKFDPDKTFEFPIGTVISKTFYYVSDTNNGNIKETEVTSVWSEDRIALQNVRLIETRLLVRREQGWVALPYVWNEDRSDAVLKRTGDAQRLTLTRADSSQEDFTYIVPNANQCAGCHATNATTREIVPIGPKARHLNRDFTYPEGVKNQLEAWSAAGILKGAPNHTQAPRNAVWDDLSASLDSRARAYLDINCAHCHNRNGPADTSGLLLEHDAPLGPSLGLCKLPIAAGKGTGGRSFGIVPGEPAASIFTYRMASTDPSIMMPELGRALSHDEGVRLIEEWIAAMDGDCT